MDTHALQQQRNRLRRGAVYALLLIWVAGGFGFIDSWTEAITPKPDYYNVLFEELARQHFLTTGTTTLVKEDSNTLQFFEKQYNLRNQKYGFPSTSVNVPESELLQFSYVPGGFGISGTSVEEILSQQTSPIFRFTEPSGSPLALWVYSKQQGILACVFYEFLDPIVLKAEPPSPDYRIIESLDREGVKILHGSLPTGKVVPIHAYLLPLGEMRLENLDRHSSKEPDLRRFDFALPLLFGSRAKGMGSSPYMSDKGTIKVLRAEAALPFNVTRWCFRWLVLPLGLLWFLMSFKRVTKLYQRYRSTVEAHMPVRLAYRIGFLDFLSGNLETRMREAITGSRAEQSLLITKQKEDAERRSLKEELQAYRGQLEISAEQVKRFDKVLLGGSIEELRRLAVLYRPIVEQRQDQLEIEQQKAREREREIRRLESELETIPLEQRNQEAREAWSLYQLAKSIEDARGRLKLLKEARKKLPRELRPDRF